MTADDLVFCRGCGGKVHPTAPVCPHCGYVLSSQVSPSPVPPGPGQPPSGQNAADQAARAMSFGEAIRTCLRKYATFEGRAQRQEYWYFYLFTVLLHIGAAMLKLPDLVQSAITLGFFLPSISAASRRLHDMGRSGWNQLWVVTIIGIIPVLYWLCQPGTPGPNRFGPPLAEPGA